MFRINKDLTIECTRGDAAIFSVNAKLGGEDYTFCKEDIVRFSVFERKNCANVVLQKDVTVSEPTNAVEIQLEKEDTKFGGAINKPKEYWYEVELNPNTYPQTIIGYDDNGEKVFILYPESVMEV